MKLHVPPAETFHAPDGSVIPDPATLAPTVAYIERAVLEGRLDRAADALDELTQGEELAIWKSPGSGGPFSLAAWKIIARGDLRTHRLERKKRKPGRSLRAAINAKCKACTYDPLSGLGNWRQQVGACTLTHCALWEVRPVSKPHR